MVGEAGEAVPAQDVADRRARHPDERRQPVGTDAMGVAGGEDRVHVRLGQRPRRASCREVRPASPASPSASNRRSQFQAVWRLTPAMWAACATAIPSMRLGVRIGLTSKGRLSWGDRTPAPDLAGLVYFHVLPPASTIGGRISGPAELAAWTSRIVPAVPTSTTEWSSPDESIVQSLMFTPLAWLPEPPA